MIDLSEIDADESERAVVVLIDDDPHIRQSLPLALEDRYEVIACANGDEGVLAVTPTTAAVILDIKMERKDGFDTFREIKDSFLYLPIIFHTAYQDLKNPYEIMNEYRPFGYIVKGRSLVELRDTINSAVDYYRRILINQRLLVELDVANTRLETLLAGTRKMARARDADTAALVALGLMLDITFPDLAAAHIYTGWQSTAEESVLMRRRIERETRTGDDTPVELDRDEKTIIADLHRITLQNGRLWVPVLFDGRLLAAFAFEARPAPDATRDESALLSADDAEFITSITHSLALVLENIRSGERERLASIGRMASGLVHDMNNNISVIQSFAQMADDETIDRSERTEYLQIINQESERLAQMAQDILGFTRGEISLERAPVDVAEYLNDVCRFLQMRFQRKEIACTVDIEAGARARLDADRFRRVVINIAGNAYDALPRGGRFAIRARRVAGGAHFEFSDDGPGIPPAIRERLFLPFVSYGKSHGTGLGMAMVRHIVEAHGGSIRFETETDRGTTFLIEIPDQAD